jgi:hypothetical protein
MPARLWLTRARKALRMPPRYVAGRVRDEALQQAKRPWALLYPKVLSNRALLGSLRALSVHHAWDELASTRAFFLRPDDAPQWVNTFRDRFPEEPSRIVAAGESVLRHEFDLLGSGRVALGPSLPWHTDFKTRREWPLQYCRDIEYLELDRPSDVKVPWELSRSQHFTTLGQAYWLTGDERFAEEFAAEVDDWIARNPLAYGVNWACAMDVALRAVSWIWGFFFFARSAACRPPAFRRRFLRALFMHGEFVFRNLETSDVNGNHYLSDGVGLVFLGSFFRHTERGLRWLARGRAIVTGEIVLQVTEDGVDFEASTAYHRLVAEAFLTAYLLLDRQDDAVPRECWDRLARMMEFVAAYTKPDGRAPLIGDADDGRIQKLGPQDLNDHRYLLSTAAARLARADLKQAAGRFWEESYWMLGPEGAAAFDRLPPVPAPPRSAAFPNGGFYVLRARDAHVVVDCGGVGMRGRGGHGHNDSLSFELFLAGTNAVTDCGAYVYTASRDWRNRFRGTAFHNTIQIDGEEINRFVGEDALWQLANDATPADVAWHFDERGSFWEGSHLGYERLPSPARPRRAIWVDGAKPLVVFTDVVSGTGVHTLVWRWHLDPACRAELVNGDCRIAAGERDLWLLPLRLPGAALRIEDGWVSPSYGVKTPASVIALEARCQLPVECSWLFAAARLSTAARTQAASELDAYRTATAGRG